MAPKRIALAYSGGLDTSVALRWLIDTYDVPVVAVIVDVGQAEDLEGIARKSLQVGAADAIIEDAREEFASNFIFPMLRTNARYEGTYLLGSAIARPLIAKRHVEVAWRLGADAVAHGATGKGNDQVRFELAYAAIDSELEIIAPWRMWKMRTRRDLVDYAREHSIPIDMGNDGGNPLSIDQNLMHTSYEGHLLENPAYEPSEGIFRPIRSIRKDPKYGELVTIEFVNGNVHAINGNTYSPRAVLELLNVIGQRYGIGRCDMVESRIVGMKSRNVYETPGATIIHAARRSAEAMCLDKEVLFLLEELMPRYARMVYHGLWFSPERQILQVAFDKAQMAVNATITVRTRSGSIDVVSRDAPKGLYCQDLASFDDPTFLHEDATGYLRLTGLRLRLWAQSLARGLKET